MAKQDLPNVVESGIPKTGENFIQEQAYYETLYRKTNRTNSGQLSFTNTATGATYNTTTYEGEIDIYDKGETGMMNLLARHILKNYLITAADFNNKLDKSGDTLTGDINADGKKITGLPTPTSNNEPATKGYADNIYKNYIGGYVAYTDSISALSSLVKTINIPSGAYRGVAVVRNPSTIYTQYKSIYISFTINNNDGKIYGTYGSSNSNSCAWTVRQIGTVTDGNYGYGVAGGNDYNSKIFIRQFYIDSANNQIKIVFENTGDTNYSLNCIIDWEVWY